MYRETLIQEADYNDLSRVNGACNNNYHNKETFLKALMHFQGKQIMDFPQSMIDEFTVHCKKNRVKMDALDYVTTRPIFQSLGWSSKFDHINLFLFVHPLVKRPLPNLSDYEAAIISDYDQFIQVYPEVKNDRESALNAWYLIYILATRLNAPCYSNDLKMPDTTSIQVANDNTARDAYALLGWEFKDTI